VTAPLVPALPGYDDPELIAHGTTALVFRAMQTRLNRLVAIKVITAETGEGSVPLNVERELATTVALSSQPHIVSIIDTGLTEDGRRYIVMEYCEGGSYAQILRQNGPLPVDDVVEVGIAIGQALHAAHEAGIVHRDVKPSNILRSRFGPALTDFGIARGPDELSGTLTREMMTPHHASPEAMLHEAQSGLSDVYSLASTMWTLLVGHPPFVEPTQPNMDIYAFRDRVLHEALPPMERADVPEWLVAELRRAMAKLPEQRHASALAFSEALQRGSLGLGAPSRSDAEAEELAVRPVLGVFTPSIEGGPVRPVLPPPPRAPEPSAPDGTPGFGPAPIYVPAPPPPAATDIATQEWPRTDLVLAHPRPRRDWAVVEPRRTRGRAWLIAAVTVLLLISATSGVMAFVFARSGVPAAPTSPSTPTDHRTGTVTPRSSSSSVVATPTQTTR